MRKIAICGKLGKAEEVPQFRSAKPIKHITANTMSISPTKKAKLIRSAIF